MHIDSLLEWRRFLMTLVCGQLFRQRAMADQSGLHNEQEHSASECALGGSIRLLLLAYECNIKTKFHVAGSGLRK